MDDYCPQCWKKDKYVDWFTCPIHSKYLKKEHLVINGNLVCGQVGKNLITFENGEDVDPDIVCKKCKNTLKYHEHTLIRDGDMF